jgi:hypothetical protein
MSDDEGNIHTGRRVFLHFVFVPADNLTDEQIQKGIDCLMGHAFRGHGFSLCDPLEFLNMIEQPGGIQKITGQLMAWRERFEDNISDVKVDMNPGDDDDPFGLYSQGDDETTLH